MDDIDDPLADQSRLMYIHIQMNAFTNLAPTITPANTIWNFHAWDL